LATPLRPTFTSCLSSNPPVAAEADQLRINDVLASIVSGQEASTEGLQGNGVQVLRIDLIGESMSVLEGYDNVTNKLGEFPNIEQPTDGDTDDQQHYSSIPRLLVSMSTRPRLGYAIL
jgi:hypothetical protein